MSAPKENPARLCEWCPACSFRAATYQADTVSGAMYRCQKCGHGFEAARPKPMGMYRPVPVTDAPYGCEPAKPVNDKEWRAAA